MRWESLFEDMEAQLAAADRAGLRADVAELVRGERATVHLSDRLRGSVGRALRVRVAGDEPLEGELVDATDEWLLLSQGGDRRVLVPLRAVAAVAGVGPHVAPEPGRVERRLGLGHALRVLARDRAAVVLRAGEGDVGGRLGSVGRDYVDVVTGDGAPGATWAIPFAALRSVRTG
ncbi:hypothetical protein [Cellulomonas edaphi]|uniref:Fis family transcriptional regulator n=1 Tax=Cellulomonas edaphi TaxID=3053468 RepID=A0ABT7S7W4_9CELL|nr:hypothetical protein [Cellulomons edaphi]MDM7831718.1 hypothetical protein [Cellulomons edaphi]